MDIGNRHRRTPIEERFWPKVMFEMNSGCWLWMSSLDTHGYGQIARGGRGGGSRLAHRLSWEMRNGSIPDGLLVCHKCDTPSCVNPDHMFLGTDADNTKDKLAKNRQPSHVGAKNPHAKLSPADVAAIRSSEADRLSLARLYGVSRTHIGYIQRHKSWKGENRPAQAA